MMVVHGDAFDGDGENLCKKCHFAHRVVEAAHFELAHLISQELFKWLLHQKFPEDFILSDLKLPAHLQREELFK